MGIFIFSVLLLVQSWTYRRILQIRYLLGFMLALCLVSFFTLNVYMANSLEAKILFSRLRFIGLGLIAPTGFLFFTSLLKKWTWLHKSWAQTFLFLPPIGTIFVALGVFDPQLLVHSQTPFEYLGVSVLTFKTGPWFSVHYHWNNALTLAAFILLAQAAITESGKRKQIVILLLAVFGSTIVDVYCVATDSPFRWLMVSAGTFAITEFAVLYVSNKYDMMGVLSAEKQERAHLRESLEFQKKTLTLLAHDLSGNIRQQAKLAQILRKKIQDNHHEILDAWSDSAQASDDLIHNIMKWIKSQGDSFKPQTASVEIRSLIENCVSNVQPNFNTKRVDVKIETPTASFRVNCDAEMMSSIIRNLLSNALKASEDGTTVFVRITDHGSQIKFSVDDAGRGLEPDKIKSLLTAQGAQMGGGYGFGLILVRHFVELHHGTLEIASAPQKGTQVYFSIPR